MIEEEPIIPIPEEQNDTCEPQNIEIEIPIEKDLISKEGIIIFISSFLIFNLTL